jgi:hypothetical protein
LHDYSSFSVTILKYINIINLDSTESKKLMLERKQYYINTLAPEYNILRIADNPFRTYIFRRDTKFNE